MITRMLEASKKLASPKKDLKTNTEKEYGMAADLFSTCIVIIVTFVLVLVMLTFSKVVEIKIDSDIIGKNYLYKMEQQGYLDTDTETALKKAFVDKGITKTPNDVTVDKSTNGTTTRQVAYGSPVKLKFTVNFTNPMHEMLPSKVYGFGNLNLKGFFKDKLSYTLEYTTTSKW